MSTRDTFDPQALALGLRDAAKSLAYSHLALRAGQWQAAAVHVRAALKTVVTAECSLPRPNPAAGQRAPEAAAE